MSAELEAQLIEAEKELASALAKQEKSMKAERVRLLAEEEKENGELKQSLLVKEAETTIATSLWILQREIYVWAVSASMRCVSVWQQNVAQATLEQTQMIATSELQALEVSVEEAGTARLNAEHNLVEAEHELASNQEHDAEMRHGMQRRTGICFLSMLRRFRLLTIARVWACFCTEIEVHRQAAKDLLKLRSVTLGIFSVFMRQFTKFSQCQQALRCLYEWKTSYRAQKNPLATNQDSDLAFYKGLSKAWGGYINRQTAKHYL